MKNTLFYASNNITENDIKAIFCEINIDFIQKHGCLIILYLNVLLIFFSLSLVCLRGKKEM